VHDCCSRPWRWVRVPVSPLDASSEEFQISPLTYASRTHASGMTGLFSLTDPLSYPLTVPLSYPSADPSSRGPQTTRVPPGAKMSGDEDAVEFSRWPDVAPWGAMLLHEVCKIATESYGTIASAPAVWKRNMVVCRASGTETGIRTRFHQGARSPAKARERALPVGFDVRPVEQAETRFAT
jgi:hypothetical protein